MNIKVKKVNLRLMSWLLVLAIMLGLFIGLQGLTEAYTPCSLPSGVYSTYTFDWKERSETGTWAIVRGSSNFAMEVLGTHPKMAGNGGDSDVYSRYHSHGNNASIVSSIVNLSGMNTNYLKEMRYIYALGSTHGLTNTQSAYWRYLAWRRPDLFNQGSNSDAFTLTQDWYSSKSKTYNDSNGLPYLTVTTSTGLNLGDKAPIKILYKGSAATGTINGDSDSWAGPFQIVWDTTSPGFSPALAQINYGLNKDITPMFNVSAPGIKFFTSKVSDPDFAPSVSSFEMGQEFYAKYSEVGTGTQAIKINLTSQKKLTTLIEADEFFYSYNTQYQYGVTTDTEIKEITLNCNFSKNPPSKPPESPTPPPDPPQTAPSVPQFPSKPSIEKTVTEYNGTNAKGDYEDEIKLDPGDDSLYKVTLTAENKSSAQDTIFKFGYPDFTVRPGDMNYVEIRTAQQFLSELDSSTAVQYKRVRLMNDIDLSGVNVNSWPSLQMPRILDGNGFSIYGAGSGKSGALKKSFFNDDSLATTSANEQLRKAIYNVRFEKMKFDLTLTGSSNNEERYMGAIISGASKVDFRNVYINGEAKFTYSGNNLTMGYLAGKADNSTFNGVVMDVKATAAPSNLSGTNARLYGFAGYSVNSQISDCVLQEKTYIYGEGNITVGGFSRMKNCIMYNSSLKMGSQVGGVSSATQDLKVVGVGEFTDSEIKRVNADIAWLGSNYMRFAGFGIIESASTGTTISDCQAAAYNMDVTINSASTATNSMGAGFLIVESDSANNKITNCLSWPRRIDGGKKIAGFAIANGGTFENSQVNGGYYKTSDGHSVANQRTAASGFITLYAKNGKPIMKDCITKGSVEQADYMGGFFAAAGSAADQASTVRIENCVNSDGRVQKQSENTPYGHGYISGVDADYPGTVTLINNKHTINDPEATTNGLTSKDGLYDTESGLKEVSIINKKANYTNYQIVYVHDYYYAPWDAVKKPIPTQDLKVWESNAWKNINTSTKKEVFKRLLAPPGYTADNTQYNLIGGQGTNWGPEVHIQISEGKSFDFYFSAKALPKGKYHNVVYITPGNGFGWDGDNDNAWVEVENEQARVAIASKLIDNSYITTLNGTEFSLYAFDSTKPNGRGTLLATCNPESIEGKAFNYILEQGKRYVVAETNAPSQYSSNIGKQWYLNFTNGIIELFTDRQMKAANKKTLSTEVGSDGITTYTYTVYNEVNKEAPRAPLRVEKYDISGIKIDGELIDLGNGKGKYWSGATYSIEKCNTNDFNGAKEAYGFVLECNNPDKNTIMLPEGYYVLSELKAPDGWVIDPTRYFITVDSAGKMTITDNHADIDQVGYIEGKQTMEAAKAEISVDDKDGYLLKCYDKKPEYEIIIVKRNGYTNDKMGGIDFTVQGTGSTVYESQSYTTVTEGTDLGTLRFTLPHGENGTYKVSEIPLNGYSAVPDYQIETKDGDIVISEGPEGYNKVIIKPGGHVLIRNNDGDKYVKPGDDDYPEGLFADDTGRIGFASGTLTIKNYCKSIYIMKEDVDGSTENQNLISTFVMYDKATTPEDPLYTFITGSDDPTPVVLPKGTFFIKEIAAPAGYQPNDLVYTLEVTDSTLAITGGSQDDVDGRSMKATVEKKDANEVYALHIKSKKRTVADEKCRVVVNKTVLNKEGNDPTEQDYEEAGFESNQEINFNVIIKNTDTNEIYSGMITYKNGVATPLVFDNLIFGHYQIKEIVSSQFNANEIIYSIDTDEEKTYNTAFKENNPIEFEFIDLEGEDEIDKNCQITFNITSKLKQVGFYKIESAKNIFKLDPNVFTGQSSSLVINVKNLDGTLKTEPVALTIIPPIGNLSYDYDPVSKTYTVNSLGSVTTVTVYDGTTIIRGLTQPGDYAITGFPGDIINIPIGTGQREATTISFG